MCSTRVQYKCAVQVLCGTSVRYKYYTSNLTGLKAHNIIYFNIFYVTSTERTHHNNSRHKVLSLTFPSSSCHKSLF